MLVEKVYTGKIVLHEESAYDPDKTKEENNAIPNDEETLFYDPRLDLHRTWPTKIFKVNIEIK